MEMTMHFVKIFDCKSDIYMDTRYLQSDINCFLEGIPCNNIKIDIVNTVYIKDRILITIKAKGKEEALDRLSSYIINS